jgi:Leucine-rich repeat
MKIGNSNLNMDRDVQLTPELIKSVSDKFSLEIIFILDLTGAGVREITNIDLCINLLHLNLSHNKISRIRGVGACTELVLLDLSCNDIGKIEGLRTLSKLERLDLSGNKIASLNGINDIQSLPKLRCLNFQQFDFTDQNPVCRESNYRENVFNSMLQIASLDGHRKKSNVISRQDLSKYEVNTKSIKLNIDNKPWVGPYASKEDRFVADDSEIKSLLKECKSILTKGDQILSNVR